MWLLASAAPKSALRQGEGCVTVTRPLATYGCTCVLQNEMKGSGQKRVRRLLTALAAGAALCGLAWASFWQGHLKRFQEVRPGVFYRSAQPSELGMRLLVKWYGVKTVVSLQLCDVRLHRGLIDVGEANGKCESEFVAELGARAVQWPMGEEACWPWVTPWQFEQFFRLMDEPSNWPVAVHCQGGRHRTGTLAALYRMEYDRWPAERALAEMYAFDFGMPVAIQEYNLLTYWPRPRPGAEEWAALAAWWPRSSGPVPADYEALVRRLRADAPGGALRTALARYVQEEGIFSLPLACRVIDEPNDPLAALAVPHAVGSLARLGLSGNDYYAAAALIADFGTPAQQERLLALLGDSGYRTASRERFEYVVRGLTNRYTPNRVAFLRPLLEIGEPHLTGGERQARYCDTAVARLSCILNLNFLAAVSGQGREGWERARQAARRWYEEDPQRLHPSTLLPPPGRNMVRANERRAAGRRR